MRRLRSKRVEVKAPWALQEFQGQNLQLVLKFEGQNHQKIFFKLAIKLKKIFIDGAAGGKIFGVFIMFFLEIGVRTTPPLLSPDFGPEGGGVCYEIECIMRGKCPKNRSLKITVFPGFLALTAC